MRSALAETALEKRNNGFWRSDIWESPHNELAAIKAVMKSEYAGGYVKKFQTKGLLAELPMSPEDARLMLPNKVS